VTNAIFASLHRLAGRPFALRPRLFRSAKNALVTSEHLQIAATAGGFRLWSAGGVALRQRFAKRFSPLSAPLSPPADHRPKPNEKPHASAIRELSGRLSLWSFCIIASLWCHAAIPI
jgi:hypothetical protein